MSEAGAPPVLVAVTHNVFAHHAGWERRRVVLRDGYAAIAMGNGCVRTHQTPYTLPDSQAAPPSHDRHAGTEKTPGAQGTMKKHRIYTMPFARVYPEYVAKAERKGRTKAEVDETISWLTGYDQKGLDAQLENQTDIETFIADAPQLNPARSHITGVVCGVRVEDIEEPTMREIRYLDKLVDELARGKPMDKILRQP